MDIHASIIDQRIISILENNPAWFRMFGYDEDKKKSAAFVLLSMSTLMNVPLKDAVDMLTEGGNDVGVDGLHIGEVEDDGFTVTVFQGKYKRNLDGEAHFPENGVQKSITTVGTLFDPSKHVEMNDKIAPKIEEIRSLIQDGYIPMVRVVLCNNGQRWQNSAQDWIDQSGFSEEHAVWIHYNHDSIVTVLQSTKPIDDSLYLEGQALVEGFKFRRVLVGKVPVAEIGALFNRHGDRLLERNIRLYLGLRSNRVNTAINDTLTDARKMENFYFSNNGITIICNKFRHNALQSGNYQVKLENMQIINGGQTCKTIQHTLNESQDANQFSDVFVMVRIYELEREDKEFVRDITFATNSQNPVDLRDLKADDPIQQNLEITINYLGYTYKRKSEGGVGGSNVITSAIVAESALAIWRRKPHQAKFRRKEHFGKLYNDIFTDLTGAQALMAVLIFRFVENERKRPSLGEPPIFLPYASHYLAMLMGGMLLRDNDILVSDISHQNVKTLQKYFDQKKVSYHRSAIHKTRQAIDQFYGIRELSLQQLAATFRRGDLLEMLCE